MADKLLREQIERINDEGCGANRNVIVRMKNPAFENKELIEACSDAIRRRALSTSAREVLPAENTNGSTSHAKKYRSGAAAPTSSAVSAAVLPSRNSRTVDQLAPANQSLAAQLIGYVNTQPAVVTTVEELKRSGMDALKPLYNNRDVVSEAVRMGAGQLRADPVNHARKSAQSQAAPHGGKVTPHDAILPLWASSSAVLNLTKDGLHRLSKEVPNVEAVYPNRTLRIPRIAEARRLSVKVEENRTSAWGVHAINALAAWGAYNKRGGGVKVAILDTGVDPTHPDLKGKIDGWAEFDDYGRPVPNSKAHDSAKHGTHCAGIICGGNASGRYIGVAPDARLYCALVLNGERGGSDAQIQAGMQWAIEQKVDVISMSLGGLTIGPYSPDTYTDQIVNAIRLGIPVVTAIGNDGSQTSGSPGNDVFAFAVGAHDVDERAAGFSGGGTQIIRESRYLTEVILPLPYSKPEVSAPGVGVLSSVPGNKWEAFNGTSMATPHVAGAIALLLSSTDIRQREGGPTRAFIIQDLLTGSVHELGEAGQNHRFGFGRIDVLSAIGFAKQRGY